MRPYVDANIIEKQQRAAANDALFKTTNGHDNFILLTDSPEVLRSYLKMINNKNSDQKK